MYNNKIHFFHYLVRKYYVYNFLNNNLQYIEPLPNDENFKVFTKLENKLKSGYRIIDQLTFGTSNKNDYLEIKSISKEITFKKSKNNITLKYLNNEVIFPKNC